MVASAHGGGHAAKERNGTVAGVQLVPAMDEGPEHLTQTGMGVTQKLSAKAATPSTVSSSRHRERPAGLPDRHKAMARAGAERDAGGLVSSNTRRRV